MKQKNRIFNTILIIFLGLILVSMFKYFHFLKQPTFIQDTYHSFVSYPGVGGILSILTITGATFLIFNIWKKSIEEKLIEVGKADEVENIKILFSEGLLTEEEVDNKFDILLKESQKDIVENDKKIEYQKKLELIKQLSKLKEKGVLTESEFEIKKEQVLAKKQIEID